MNAVLNRVLLSWPQHLAAMGDEGTTPTSWMQIARTGEFTSSRYGKFAITKADLSQMLANFTDITPKAPTRLPVDYDHLSMDPKKPGDGIAAGWIAELELRNAGDTLWAKVAWTADAARRIKAKEYLFVSPSFVKDYTHKDGKKIGTTLLAAAITNHPFLEEMEALALNADQLGQFALATPPPMQVDGMQPGQRVMVKPEFVHGAGHIGVAFEIAEVVGQGSDAFAALRSPDGSVLRWFRATELTPSLVTSANRSARPTTDTNLGGAMQTKNRGSQLSTAEVLAIGRDALARGAAALGRPPRASADTATTEVRMNTNAGDTELLQILATKIQRERGISFGDALKAAAGQRMDLAEQHRSDIGDPEFAVDSAPTPADAGMQLSLKATEIAQQERISPERRDGLASQRHPELVKAYGDHFNCGER